MAWDQWGSREFQWMSLEIQRMSPERMSREFQWTEPRVPEGVPKVQLVCGGYDDRAWPEEEFRYAERGTD